MSNSQYQNQASQKNTTHQQILMDWQGYILESTDTVFSTLQLKHRPATEWSHFLESFFPVLQSLELSSPEIFLPRIGSVTNFLEGIYDCSFMRVEWGDNDRIIVWNIIDYTFDLPRIQQAQQRFNEMRIRGRV
jgi:hypothetical protein